MICFTVQLEKDILSFFFLFWSLSPTFPSAYLLTVMLECPQPFCIKFYIGFFFMALLLQVISECSNFSGFSLPLPGVV